MPEGHTLHRIATEHSALLAGRRIGASSPQGRFAAGAALIDGEQVRRVTAYGKHLFYDFAGTQQVLHIHLGLYGTFATGAVPAPEPRGALRLRLTTAQTWIDLRGATACELIEPREVEAILDRLGPDPLARAGSKAADPQRAWARLSRSRTPIAGALMDQSVIAGIGNVYRAELLFLHGLDPYSPARQLSEAAWTQLWADTVRLMRAGVNSGRIVTTRPADRSRRGSPVRGEDAHYVYRRQGLPCRWCGTPIAVAELAGRRLYWCPSHQTREGPAR